MINLLVHIGFLLVFPPLLLGVINKTKARFAGRRGPPLLQPYWDIAKLMRKGVALSTTVSWIFVAGPLVGLATVLLAGVLVPQGPLAAPVCFAGDVILFAYLLALGRFFTAAAALDTGSPFEGMGAAREVTFACLAEPAMFLALLVLVRLSGALNLAAMLHAPTEVSLATAAAPLVLVGIGLFVVLLAESCRIPVDDPTTHLELTMIHEAMVLDHSGPLLGMILYAAALKMFILGTILLHVVVPFRTGHAGLDWGIYVAALLGLAVLIGVVESVMARLQMRHVPYLLTAALLSCGLGFALLIR